MKLKSILIFVFCLVFLSCKKEEIHKIDEAKVNEAKVNEAKTLKINLERNKIDVQNELKNIKDNFKRINNIKKWTVIDSLDLYESAEGGQATFYFANKQLQKIVAVYYGETGKIVEEYYLLNNKLSFVYRKDFKYNSSIYSNENEKFNIEKSNIFESRSYFYNDILFEQIKSSGNKQEILNENLDQEQQNIIQNFSNLKKLSLVRQT